MDDDDDSGGDDEDDDDDDGYGDDDYDLASRPSVVREDHHKLAKHTAELIVLATAQSSALPHQLPTSLG